MLFEDGIAFDVAPRGPSWRPYQGVLTPRMKLWLQRLIGQAREMLAPDNFDDNWELTGLKAIAAGREPIWIGKV